MAAEDRGWLGERPRGDAIAERMVLQRLEARIMDDRPGPVMLSRYVVLEQIGRGGLGSVYRAYDPQLDRSVAIKVLHDRRESARLLREAQALARLSHPNVVTVHDVGVADDGAVFVAMELVEGSTISAWLAERSRSWTEVRDVFEQAGRGLLAAHEAGLVHRDFKPSNAIVGNGNVRVLDFGLARAAGGTEEPEDAPRNLLAQTVTAAGTWLGTPAYVAPEQIRGEDAGPPADQFSFCVALYEGLYGERPFVGEDVEQTLAAIRRCDPPSRPVGSRVPAWMHAVLLRGLRRAPTERWSSMADLLHALVRDRRSRRRQRIAIAGALVLATMLGAGAVLAFQPEPAPAEVELVDRLADEARAAASESWFVYPPADDPDRATAYRKVLELEAQTGAAETLAHERAAQLRADFAATLVRLGDAYWEREGGAPFASDYYAAALVFEPEHAHARARTTLTPGEVHALVDKAAEADFSPSELVAGESLAVLAEDDPDRRASRARELLARREGPATSTEDRLRALVGDAAESPGRPAAAPSVTASSDREDASTAAAVSTPQPEPQRSQGRASAAALVAEAKRESRAGNVEAARALLHRALRADRNHHPALAALAHHSFEAAQYHEAIRFAERAVAIAPRHASYWQLLGDAHFRVLAYEEARRAYRKAADLGQASAHKRLALVDARTGGSPR